MVAVSLLVATALHVTPLPTQADIHWIGVSAPTTNVVWLSGSQATIARSTDGGTNWEYFKPTNDNLQFRDIEALDANHAYALSIGENGDSRVYYTSNGGRNWQLRYRAPSTQFLNCLAIGHNGEAWVYGDSQEGRWAMVRSADGRNWLGASNVVDSAPLPDEGGLAASGGCIRYHNQTWAIGTANGSTARLLLKRNFGIRYRAIDTPLPAGPSAGIASVWPISHDHVVLAGGDLNNPAATPRLVRYQNGEFTALPEPSFAGALYSLTVRNNGDIIVTNPNGAGYLPATATDWHILSSADIWNSTCSSQYCYLVGKDGFVARISFDE